MGAVVLVKAPKAVTFTPATHNYKRGSQITWHKARHLHAAGNAVTTRLTSSSMLLAVLLAGLLAVATARADFAFAPALSNPTPEGDKLIDIARQGDRIFIAGERGLIAFSDDGGATWAQAEVPVSGTLAAITFTPGGTGFAVGHGGVILRSRDNGERWESVFDGHQANAQFLAWAEADQQRLEQALAELESAEQPDKLAIEDAEYALEDALFALEDAQVAIETGPADPFLAVLFVDDQVGVAVGAYGMVYRTEDGGDSWSLAIDSIDNIDRYHLYSLALDDNGRLHASGEAGLLFYSDDAGVTWTRVYDVYDGSLFALVPDKGALYAIGLRGNVFRSTDGGEQWNNVVLSGSGSLYAGISSSDGPLVLVGTGGRVVYSKDGGQTFVESIHPSRSALSDVLMDGDRLLFASMTGFFAEALGDYDGD